MNLLPGSFRRFIFEDPIKLTGIVGSVYLWGVLVGGGGKRMGLVLY